MTKRTVPLKALGGLFAAGSAGLAIYLLAIKPWHRRWGATDEEVERPMLGDEMVPRANFETTRAITIDTPPEAVWPWLVQIGQGRGGFYSYDWLENLTGLDIHSADQILPEHQNPKVGDVIPLEPEGSGYTIATLEPDRFLLLYTGAKGLGVLEQFFAQADAASTWAFELVALDGKRARLIVRWRARWNLRKSLTTFLIGLPLDPIEFIMEQKMMRGIKQRAEALQAARSRG